MGSKKGRVTIRDYIHKATIIVGELKPRYLKDTSRRPVVRRYHLCSSGGVRLYSCDGSATLHRALREDFDEVNMGLPVYGSKVWRRK